MTPALIKHVVPHAMRHWLRQVQAGLALYRQPHAARTKQNMLPLWESSGYRWSVDTAMLDRAGNTLEVAGWAYHPPKLRHLVGFTCNDRPFESVEYPVNTPGLAAVMPYLRDVAQSGFRCRTRLPKDGNGEFVFRCINRETGQPFYEHSHPYYYLRPAAGEALPEPNRRVRIMGVGGSTDQTFLLSGYTCYRMLGNALKRTVGRDIADFKDVLDWGCGCGRVSRYFKAPTRLTGVEVDPDNARWCQQHLTNGTFTTIPLYPPTKLASNAYDLIFGVSVMTHLKEPTHLQWLDELYRITRPDGIVLLSTHGVASICSYNPTQQQWAEWQRTGFLDLPDGIYDADLPEKDYYRAIFHTNEYIRRNWTKQFELVDILPCYLWHQDLVVLRKR